MNTTTDLARELTNSLARDWPDGTVPRIEYIEGTEYHWKARVTNVGSGALRFEGSFRTATEACEALTLWTKGVIIV